MHHFLVKTVLPAFREAIFLNYKSRHFIKFHLSFFREMPCSECGLIEPRCGTSGCSWQDCSWYLSTGGHERTTCSVTVCCENLSSSKHWQTAKDRHWTKHATCWASFKFCHWVTSCWSQLRSMALLSPAKLGPNISLSFKLLTILAMNWDARDLSTRTWASCLERRCKDSKTTLDGGPPGRRRASKPESDDRKPAASLGALSPCVRHQSADLPDAVALASSVDSPRGPSTIYDNIDKQDWENTKAKVQRLQETFQLTKGRESRFHRGWRYSCDFILDAVLFSDLLCRLQDDVDVLTSVVNVSVRK